MTREYQEQRETNKRTGYFLIGVLAGLLCALFLAGGIFVAVKCINHYKQKAVMTDSDGAVEGQDGSFPSVLNERTLTKLGSIEKIVNDYYYLGDMEEDQLEDGIYRGMVKALGDRYAEYYTVQELEEQLKENEGIYYGIAAYVSVDQETSYPFISGIIAGGSAEEAGLRAGDIIFQVDGESTFEMKLSDVVSMIKGDEGTMVTITIVRGEESFDVDVERKKVDRPTVTSELIEDHIGYIQISEFDSVTVDQFRENYQQLRARNISGLIIDLRGNPGGLLDAVVEIGQQILPEGLIVYTEDKAGNREENFCDGKNEIDIPLVVLVDGGSASASEILTGAVKDYGIGTIMGTQTYGKGIVQKMYSLPDGSAIKLTTSAYYTPKGNNIHEIGIQPDVVVEFDADAYYAEERVDNQKNAAIAYLEEQIKE